MAFRVLAGRKFVQYAGPLLADILDYDPTCPLVPMDIVEKLASDHHITGFTVGKHALAYQRDKLQQRGVVGRGYASQVR